MIPLRKLNALPDTLNTGAIDRALEAFVIDSREIIGGVDGKGALQQLRDSVASAIIFKNSPESFFWVAEDDNGEVAAWALTQVRRGIDNSLCYWMTNAWVAKSHRFKPYVKAWFQTMRDDAIRFSCNHILIPSSRNSRAYCRFLGGGFHEYLTILKADI